MVVFSGKVTKIEFPDKDREIQDGDPRVIVTLEVEKIWKGSPKRIVVMNTRAESSSCEGFFGYLLKPGSTWLVYAYFEPISRWRDRTLEGRTNEPKVDRAAEANEPKILTTNICVRTAPLAHANQDLSVLGEGKTP